MMISTDKIVTITEANQNFTKVAKAAHLNGDAVIFKRNKPAYLLIDVQKMGEGFLKAYEQLKLQYLAEAAIEEYHEAFKELAK